MVNNMGDMMKKAQKNAGRHAKSPGRSRKSRNYR